MVSPIKNIKQRIFDGLKTMLDPARSQEGTGEIAQKKVLVFSAQPGYEALHAGGTIGHIANSGGAVDILFLHHEKPDQGLSLESDTLSSALKACGALSVRRTLFIENTGSRRSMEDLASELLERLQAEHYDYLLVPCPSDSNTDHMKIFRTVLDAVHLLKEKKPIWLYGTERLGLANRKVNISETFSRKMAALEIYEQSDFMRNVSTADLKKEELFLAMDGAILAAISELLRHHSLSGSLAPLTPTELELVRFDR